MKRNLSLLAALPLLLAGCTQEPPVAGSMSVTTVCQTAGYLIRQKLGNATKTNDMPCEVTNTGGSNVLIESSYKPAIGNETIDYTATGVVLDDRLRLLTITTSVDETSAPYPFNQFPL